MLLAASAMVTVCDVAISLGILLLFLSRLKCTHVFFYSGREMIFVSISPTCFSDVSFATVAWLVVVHIPIAFNLVAKTISCPSYLGLSLGKQLLEFFHKFHTNFDVIQLSQVMFDLSDKIGMYCRPWYLTRAVLWCAGVRTCTWGSKLYVFDDVVEHVFWIIVLPQSVCDDCVVLCVIFLVAQSDHTSCKSFVYALLDIQRVKRKNHKFSRCYCFPKPICVHEGTFC